MNPPARTTFESTNTLKGVAILAVLINHYLNHNVSGNYLGYANLWISLFFIVSGYGIYFSLQELVAKAGGFNLRNIATFYYYRIVRIFPLFWLAYVIQQSLFDQEIHLYSLLGIHGTGHYWFVPAILQCYLIAPVIFLVTTHHRLRALVLGLFLFVIANLFIIADYLPEAFVNELKFIHLKWRGVYFLYILVFSLSMLIPQSLATRGGEARPEKYFYVVMLFLLILVVMISVQMQIDHYEGRTFNEKFWATIIPLVLMTLMSIYIIANGLSVKFLSWLGRRSYSLYLFHVSYFFLINRIFQINKDSLAELLILLVLFPVFLIFCTATDALGNRLSSSLRKLAAPAS